MKADAAGKGVEKVWLGELEEGNCVDENIESIMRKFLNFSD